MRRLVVCDSRDGAWISRARAASRPGDAWHVLLLRISVAWFEREHAASLATLGPGVQVLDVGALAPLANRAVSPFVVDLVWRLPGVQAGCSTLGAQLREGDRNLWWSLEISEKSSFRGPLVERLYRLALVEAALARATYDEIWLETGDADLSRVIASAPTLPPVRRDRPANRAPMSTARFCARYWGRATAALARFVAIRALIAVCRWSPNGQDRGGRTVFTIFPYWWTRPYAPDAVERFFSAPPDDVRYVAWLMWPHALWRERRAISALFAARRIVPLQGMLRVRDAVRLLSPARFLRLMSAGRAVRSLVSLRFGPFDVSSLVEHELTTSMTDAELFFDDLLERGLVRHVDATAPREMLYRVENQPWENALLRACSSTGTPAVGFFHSSYGPTYPALRFAPGELGGEGHGAGPRPVPPRLLVSGDVARGYLEADGYPATRIAACGPQRHADFVRFMRGRPSIRELRDRLKLPHDVPVYVVAIAIVEVETEGLFACLEPALAGQEDFRLLIKTHPNRPLGDASLRAAARAIGPGRVAFVPEAASMYDYIAAADALICIGSTVAFEAMALGVMPVVYEHPGTCAVTSLRAFDDALYVVNSPETLRRALEEVAAGAPASAARRAAFAATVRGVFGDIETPLSEQLTAALDRLAGNPAVETNS